MGSHDWKLIVLAAISCIARSCSTRDFAATLSTFVIQAQASSTSRITVQIQCGLISMIKAFFIEHGLLEMKAGKSIWISFAVSRWTECEGPPYIVGSLSPYT